MAITGKYVVPLCLSTIVTVGRDDGDILKHYYRNDSKEMTLCEKRLSRLIRNRIYAI